MAVIGCGGVGIAAIAGARLAGAGRIIAVDIDRRKLDMASGLGATHTVDGSTADVVDAVRELTDGFGADVVIDAVGTPQTYKQAFYARDLAGTVVLVGVPTPEMRLDINLQDVFGRGGAPVVLVRRLPPDTRLPHARRPLPPGPAAAGRLRQRDDRHR